MRLINGMVSSVFVLMFISSSAVAHDGENDQRRFLQIEARTKEERSAIANLGVSIEAVRSDSVWGFADPATLADLREAKIKILGDHDLSVARGGHQSSFDFPPGDSKFHNYEEMMSSLRNIQGRHADVSRVQSIGKTIEGRDIWALHINTTPDALIRGESNKPGVIYMGKHHAREHLSTEIPLLFAQHLLDNRGDAHIGSLLENRDIWIIPMVNPDGSEYDVATGKYRSWRKNRRNNGDGTYGVDLNRNYGYRWGTGGSSNNTSSDVYMGTAPFSEPETQAIRDFVTSQANTTVLISFHTFSELILYPWGNTYDPIQKGNDRATFEKMAQTMAQWNRYTPQQSSQLYIASGDTTDWAYAERGIFAFTFELSPKSMWDGGFYPGQGVIPRVFNDNLRPCLYMLEVADNPHKVLGQKTSSPWLKNFVEKPPVSRLPVLSN